MCTMYTRNFLLFFGSFYFFNDVRGKSTNTKLLDVFEDFVHTYKRPYINNSTEYFLRYNIFQDNYLLQTKLNESRNHIDSARYGPTKFSDLSQQEFTDAYLSSYHSREPFKIHTDATVESQNAVLFFKNEEIPKKLDWRDKLVVTPVKEQRACGGCWAFSAVGAVESNYARYTGQLEPLSVQEVIDCSVHYKNTLNGCNGGDTCIAFEWMKKENVSLVTEKIYPTDDKCESCKINPQAQKGIKIRNYTCNSYVNIEQMLVQLIAEYGPVSVSVDATSWNNYQGGIIQYHCGGPHRPNNHAVDIVGYDMTGDIPYYIVKNSWGKDYGDKGYMYLKIGSNTCGIASEVGTVEVKI